MIQIEALGSASIEVQRPEILWKTGDYYMKRLLEIAIFGIIIYFSYSLNAFACPDFINDLPDRHVKALMQD